MIVNSKNCVPGRGSPAGQTVWIRNKILGEKGRRMLDISPVKISRALRAQTVDEKRTERKNLCVRKEHNMWTFGLLTRK